MINVFSIIFIILSNSFIYFYTLNASLDLVFPLILTSLFEYTLIFSFEKKIKYYKTVMSAITILLGIFKIALSIYYKHFGDFKIFSRIKQAKHLAGIPEFIAAELFSPTYILVFLMSLILVFLILSRKDLKYTLFKRKKNKKKVFSRFAILFLLMTFTNLFASSNEYYSIALKSAIFPNKKTSYEDYESTDYSNIIFRNYKHKNKFTGLVKDKNLLVIQVESLHGIFLDKKVDGIEITPFINQLTKKKGSIYFSKYYELLGFGNTSDAEYISFHSNYPNVIDSSYVTYEDTETFGLPKILSKYGYDTASFHGNTGKFYNRDFYHKNIGFNKSYFGEYYKQNELIRNVLSDGSFFRQTSPLIEELDKNGNYFGFVITLTSHVPYDMPEEYRIFSSSSEERRNSQLYKYMDSINYVDKELKNFLEDLENKGLLENTIVAIYGDHYAMEIHDKDENRETSEFLGHEYYYDDKQLIPLILLIPDLEENIQIDRLGSQLDFLPTILNLFDLNAEVLPMFGVDLLDEELSKDNIVYPQTHLLKGSYYTEDEIFEKSRVSGDQGGTLTKNGEKTRLDKLNETSLKGIKLIDYSNYLYENNLLKDEIEKFKKK